MRSLKDNTFTSHIFLMILQNTNKKQIDRVVYKTTNLINGKVYIGKDSFNYQCYLGSGKVLKEDIKKYGKENFKKEIICKCETNEELNIKEKFWIKFYKENNFNIYNINPGSGGGDTMSNNPNIIEIGNKIRLKKLNTHHSLATRNKMKEDRKDGIILI